MSTVICPISGIPLIRAPYMLGLSLREVHPIFRVKRADLITPSLIHKFNKSESTEEKRLIFLGVLASTDLITFNCIACPSLKTIEKNFIQATIIAGWIDYAHWQVSKEIPMPHYVVNPETADMANIGAFLASVDEIRTENLKQADARKNEVVDRLFKELHDSFKRERFLTPFVIDWVLEYCELSKHPHAARFKEMMLTKKAEAWGLDRDALQELHDKLEVEFNKNHPIYAPFFGQLNRLIAEQKKGAQAFEIVDEIESYIDSSGAQRQRKVDLGTAYTNKMVAAYGTTDMPQPEMFESKGKYLQAMARWRLSQTASASASQTSQTPDKGNSNV